MAAEVAAYQGDFGGVALPPAALMTGIPRFGHRAR